MPDSQSYLPNLVFQSYVAPQEDQPVKEFEQGLQVLNQRYDDNIANYDKLDEMMNQLQVRQPDQHIKDSLLSDTRNAISNVAKNGNWEDASVPIREIAKRFRNDPSITMAQQNYAAEQDLDKQKLQAAIEGRPLIQFKDYKNQSTVQPDGTLRRLDTEGVFEGKLDPYSKMEQFLQINPDAFSKDESSPVRDEQSGAIYQVGHGTSARYITADKVRKVVENAFPAFMQTKEGEQLHKIYTTTNSENTNPVDSSTALAQIKDQMLRLGYNKTFNDVSSKNSERLAPARKGSGTGNDDYRMMELPALSTSNDVDALKDALVKKERGPSAQERGIYNIQSEDAAANNGVQPKDLKNSTRYGNIPSNMKDQYQSLYDMFSNQLGTKDKDQIHSAMSKYLDNIKTGKISPKIFSFADTKQINNENNFYRNGNYDGLQYLDPSTGKVLTVDQIKKDYQNDKGKEISDADFRDAIVQGEISQDNPYYDMTKGNPAFSSPRSVLIGGKRFIAGAAPQTMSEANFPTKVLATKISQSTRTGLPVKLPNGIKVYPKDGGYLIAGSDGIPRNSKPLSLEDAAAILNDTPNIHQ